MKNKEQDEGKLINLERAYQLNEESKHKAYVIMIQHKKYLQNEATRFHQIIGEID